MIALDGNAVAEDLDEGFRRRPHLRRIAGLGMEI
jgi:hypothetical protein